MKKDDGTISISSSEVQKFIECPWHWKLDSEFGTIIQENEYTIYGKAIHSAIQSLYSQSLLKARLDYTEELRAKFEEHKIPWKTKEYLSLGLYFLDKFEESSYRKMELKAFEYPLLEPLIVNFLFFKGFIDLWLFDGTKHYILDLKTTKKGWNDETRESKKKRLQLLLYKFFLAKLEKLEYDDIICDFVLLNQNVNSNNKTLWPIIESFTIDSSREKTNSAFGLLWSTVNKMYNDKGQLVKNDKACYFCQWNSSDKCDRKSSFQDAVTLETLMNIMV